MIRTELVTAVEEPGAPSIEPPDPEERDRAADERDRAADQRDHVADRRDRVADRRDGAADQRDAENRSTRARREAAADRRAASEDRRAGTGERAQARRDRDSARADRAASARERECARVDDLTGAYLRGAGLVELECEVARARQTEQPLVLAFVAVDRLKAVNNSRGRAAGDRLLLEVAETLREALRSYDLLIRYADDEFVCVISGLSMAAAKKQLGLVSAALADAPERGSITVGLAELGPGDSPDDVVARADAVLDRQDQQRSGDAAARVWECGQIVVDVGTRSVTMAGSPVPLTGTEFRILEVLVRNRTLVVPKGQLLGEVWGYEADDHLLQVHMGSLRRKLEAHGPRMVHTVRGTGYVLRP